MPRPTDVDPDQMAHEDLLDWLQKELDRTKDFLDTVDPTTSNQWVRYTQVRRELLLKIAAAVPELAELAIPPLPPVMDPKLRRFLEVVSILPAEDLEFVQRFAEKLAR